MPSYVFLCQFEGSCVTEFKDLTGAEVNYGDVSVRVSSSAVDRHFVRVVVGCID